MPRFHKHELMAAIKKEGIEPASSMSVIEHPLHSLAFDLINLIPKDS